MITESLVVHIPCTQINTATNIFVKADRVSSFLAALSHSSSLEQSVSELNLRAMKMDYEVSLWFQNKVLLSAGFDYRIKSWLEEACLLFKIKEFFIGGSVGYI